jgi:hypothetical protein
MLLHVANGHCTTRLIESSGLPGRTTIWADPLNEGPVRDNVSDDELLQIRARFLAGHSDRAGHVANDLKSWREEIDREDSYAELVLWFEHDLFDQLNLIQLLSYLSRRPRVKPVALICIGSYPGRPGFKGLGELTPADIAALFPTRVPVTAGQIAVAERAWAAFRSADPRAIELLLKHDTSVLPFLAPALARHLEEFPSLSDGLSRTERRLMEQARDTPVELRTLLARMHAGETAYYIADSWLLDRATELTACEPPLVEVSITPDKNAASPAGTMALTAAGRAVLNGEADRVRQSGIDRWIGGVHLQGHGPVWRWSAPGGTLVRA